MKKERTWSSMNLRQNGMIIALIVIILGFGIATGGTLFRPMNISNIFMQNSYEIILAIGMFFCLTTGGNVDLSVGSVVAFAGAMMGALTLNSGMPTWQAVAITLVTGVLIGAMQGSFIAFLNVPPFIATLSGELVFRGLTQVVLQGQTVVVDFFDFQVRLRFCAARCGGIRRQCRLPGLPDSRHGGNHFLGTEKAPQ